MDTPPNLTTEEVVLWLRMKAANYLKAATVLEDVIVHQKSEITLSYLQARIRRKSARVNQLVNELNVDAADITRLIETADSDLYIAERGWIKIK